MNETTLSHGVAPVNFGGAFTNDETERTRFIAAQRRLAWRKRLLPIAAIVGLIVLWGAVVVVFNVQPFIAPSPWAVASVLIAKADILFANLLPTAMEALLGFLLGNF